MNLRRTLLVSLMLGFHVQGMQKSPGEKELQQGLERLQQAYPQAIKSWTLEEVHWKDGTVLPVKVRTRAGTYSWMLDHADLRDQVSQPYPTCLPLSTPVYLSDPGRVRSEVFFKKLYGQTPQEVESNLVPVKWLGGTVKFQGLHGAAAALRRVEQALQKNPELQKYVTPHQGTYLWRKVAGTERLSMHSFGIAIDLNGKHSNYWKYHKYQEGQKGIVYRNQIPEKLVFLFEREGFVWGGRWYHFDTMHFEYRPEMIDPSKCPIQ
ncbi:M15 family metallopeptidase [Deinococcus cellulosilyticus]|uniref:Peptidase M15C domain-containing protein n=1 Tax=Deinococcus cellulosilyticus (strain DSM 18568 / NBRC 106333 / KACC 11606 / 5516J-15) TaxID=1223518 RepID=A0A511MVU9_DEIC1|nr:M15 family metallopeptidase [Deinococcus cellulosilyticus]GEM44690.1 hypothetical protein DC3_03250 [Deinococcus cellulosilyticus NBRC 106333 = KACC 11606]